MLFAPGATTQAAYAPGRGQRLPAVDERLVAPESHAEIVDGVVHRTMGSNQPHGTRHFEATHVFAGALAETGLAPGAVARSLVAFNVGVELGQELQQAVAPQRG